MRGLEDMSNELFLLREKSILRAFRKGIEASLRDQPKEALKSNYDRLTNLLLQNAWNRGYESVKK